MKSTGIIRRIDDLGRVVIPKEIRRTMQLREGDPMEIYMHEGAVCFKKYDVAKNMLCPPYMCPFPSTNRNGGLPL